MDNDAKLRPLYLGKIFYERTDEDNLLTTNELIDILREEYGISDFRLTAAVAESHVFYAWIFGFCGKVKIEAPEDMRKAYQKMVKAAAK